MVDINETFQEIATNTHDVVTPANAISLAGFALASYGAQRMDTLPGVLVMGTGRVLDMVDGKVARATGTSSALGEMVDATLDKSAVAIMAYNAVKKDIVPRPVIASIVVQNIANTALTLYDRVKNDEPQIHPNRDGKHTMFAQNAAIGFFCLANVAKPPIIRSSLKSAGWVATAVAVVKGTRATQAYHSMATS